MRSLQLALLAAVVVCLIGASGCSPASRPADGESSAAAAVDSSGPPVKLAEVEEILARAKSPGAKATLVNVWAKWCGPCREEFPGMLAVARRHPGLRVVLVSADFDAQLGEARKFLFAHGFTDSSYLKQGDDQAFIDGIDPRWSGALPATVLYDAAGNKVAFWEGAADSAKFEQAVTEALNPSHASQEVVR